jgi:hypothetical protein
MILNLIEQFAGQRNTISIPRLLIDYSGDMVYAALLNLLLYWRGKEKNKFVPILNLHKGRLKYGKINSGRSRRLQYKC